LRGGPPVSQDDLSGRLAVLGIGITQTGISKIENQDRYVMDYEAEALAKALKVSVAWLYDEEAPGKSIAPLLGPEVGIPSGNGRGRMRLGSEGAKAFPCTIRHAIPMIRILPDVHRRAGKYRGRSEDRSSLN
jgi:hypothetical protein